MIYLYSSEKSVRETVSAFLNRHSDPVDRLDLLSLRSVGVSPRLVYDCLLLGRRRSGLIFLTSLLSSSILSI